MDFVDQNVYTKAVEGRRAFRRAYREERKKRKKLERVLKELLECFTEGSSRLSEVLDEAEKVLDD